MHTVTTVASVDTRQRKVRRGYKGCVTCGDSLAGKRSHSAFCSADCRFEYHNVRKKLGSFVIDLVLMWALAPAEDREDLGEEVFQTAVRLLKLEKAAGFSQRHHKVLARRDLGQVLGDIGSCTQ